MKSADVRDRFVRFVGHLQEEICDSLEKLDGRGRFSRDSWERPGGGGGTTRALAEGELFERGAVNTSVVHGALGERMAERLGGGGRDFFAAGISLILHPRSPRVPTVHFNLRYLERGADDAWFGGGTDLTPYYLDRADARHFHQVLKGACDRFQPGAYERFKKECDEYFFIKHRGEGRGVGGIFFDYQRQEPERTLGFVEDVGRSFLAAYAPIAERRRGDGWGERERRWQCLRRGRYVEFNLVYDRGTLFGLETGGRTESVLASLPPLVAWEYDHRPEPGSPEAELVAVLRRPIDWISSQLG